MLQMTKGQRKKAKKQQRAVVQLTDSTPAAASAMGGASLAPATTSGAELQVCPPHQLCSDHGLRFCRPLLQHMSSAETVCLCTAFEWQQVLLPISGT